MKYDLGDFFDNVPAFDAPTLIFNQKDGIVPQGIELPRKKGDGQPPKMTKREEARLNNSAIINQYTPQ